MITTINGDLIKLADTGMFQVIIHGANCQGVMGAGIAKQIVNRWPLVGKVDKETHDRINDPLKMLGHFSMARVKTESLHHLVICNAYTQLRYGYGIQIDYNAIRTALRQIHITFPKLNTFGMPKIGAGLGGGDWNVIEHIIKREMPDRDVTVVNYKNV